MLSTASATSSAMMVLGDFAGGGTSAIINNGDKVTFNAEFSTFPLDLPMTLKIELFKGNEVVYTFLNTVVSTPNYFYGTYDITKDIYKTTGIFKIRIVGTDNRGYIDSQDPDLTLTVNADTTTPVITLTGSNPQLIIRGNPYIELGATATDNIDGTLTSSIVINSSSVDTSSIGTYQVTYAVTDAAGNTGTAIREVRVASEIDSVLPVITIENPIDGTTYTSQISYLHFIATDANLAKCEYSTNNGVTKTQVVCVSGSLTSVELSSVTGSNTWIVYAEDAYGNKAEKSITFTVNPSSTDTTAPVITIMTPEAKEYTNDRISFQVITDEASSVQFSLDGRSKITMSNSYDNVYLYTVTLSNGEHNVIFYATDTAGNIAQKSIDFSINKATTAKKTVTTRIVTDEDVEKAKEKKTEGEGAIILVGEQPQQQSLLQRIFNAIINFFKSLFGIK